MRAAGLIRRGVRVVYGSRMVGRSSFWYGGYERGGEEVVRGGSKSRSEGESFPVKEERNSSTVLKLTSMAVRQATFAEENVPLRGPVIEVNVHPKKDYFK